MIRFDKNNWDEDFNDIVDELEQQALDYYCEALEKQLQQMEGNTNEVGKT